MCLSRAVPGTAHTSQTETMSSTSLLDMVVRTGRLSRQQIAFVAGSHGSRDILARSAGELASTAAGGKHDSTRNPAPPATLGDTSASQQVRAPIKGFYSRSS